MLLQNHQYIDYAYNLDFIDVSFALRGNEWELAPIRKWIQTEIKPRTSDRGEGNMQANTERKSNVIYNCITRIFRFFIFKNLVSRKKYKWTNKADIQFVVLSLSMNIKLIFLWHVEETIYTRACETRKISWTYFPNLIHFGLLMHMHFLCLWK